MEVVYFVSLTVDVIHILDAAVLRLRRIQPRIGGGWDAIHQNCVCMRRHI